MSRDFLPRQDVAFSDASGRATNPFYIWMQGIERMLQGGASLAEIRAEVANLRQIVEQMQTDGFLSASTTLFGENSIVTFGSLAGGAVTIQLENDQGHPYPFQYYGVDENSARGWRWLYDALAAGTGLVQTMDGFTVLGVLESTDDLPASSDVGDAYLIGGRLYAWDGAAWNDEGDASGVTMFALAELTNTGVGVAPIKIYTRDAYGRIEGDEDATTDELPEGATNLYFTAQRVRDVLLTGLSMASDAAITAADTVLGAFGKLQAQITALFDLKFDKAGGEITGSVGIHTATPQSILHIVGTSGPVPVFPTTIGAAVAQVIENNANVFVGLVGNGLLGYRFYSSGSTATEGGLDYQTTTGRFRLIAAGGGAPWISLDAPLVAPATDNVTSNGDATHRYADVYGVRYRPGTGSPIWTSGSGTPEGAVTAPIGSLYTRTDGGAGTTLYVKESGAGNTGWVAK